METKGQAARAASRRLAHLAADIKNNALKNIAEDILSQKTDILTANQKDYAAAEASGMSAALLDRLMLDESRLVSIAADTRSVAALDDPIGETFGSSADEEARRCGPRGAHGAAILQAIDSTASGGVRAGGSVS